MSGYTNLVRAVQEATRAANTFYNVVTSPNDKTSGKVGTAHTLTGRIKLEIENKADDFIGVDGVSISSVTVDANDDIIIKKDNGDQTVFSGLFLENGKSIAQYDYENGELVQYHNFQLDDNGDIKAGETGMMVATFEGGAGKGIHTFEIQASGDVVVTYNDDITKTEVIGTIDNFIENPIESTDIRGGNLFITVNGSEVLVQQVKLDANDDPVLDADGEFILEDSQVEGEPGMHSTTVLPNSVSLIDRGSDNYFLQFTVEGNNNVREEGPLNVTRRLAASEDMLSVTTKSVDNGTVEFLYPGGFVRVTDIHGADATDGIDATDDGEYPLSINFDEATMTADINSTLTSGKWTVDVTEETVDAQNAQVWDSNIRLSPNGSLILPVQFLDTMGNVLSATYIPFGKVTRSGGNDGTDGKTIDTASITTKVVGSKNRDMLDVSYTHEGTINTDELIDVTFDMPKSLEIDYGNPTTPGVMKMVMSDGTEIFSTDSIHGKPGVTAYVDNSGIAIDDTNNYMLSMELVDGVTKFPNLGELRPKKLFDVTSVNPNEVIFDFGASGTFPVTFTSGLDGSLISDITFVDNVLKVTTPVDVMTSLEMPTMTGVEYDHTAKELQFDYNGTSFTVPYARDDDGATGDYITGWTKTGDTITISTLDTTVADIVLSSVDDKTWVTSVTLDATDPETINVTRETGTGETFKLPNLHGIHGKVLTNVKKESGTLSVEYNEDGVFTPAGAYIDKPKWFTSMEVSAGGDLSIIDNNGVSEFIETIPDFNAGTDGKIIVAMENIGGVLKYTYQLGDNATITEDLGTVEDGTHAKYITAFSRVDDVFTFTFDDTSTQELTIENFDGAPARWVTAFDVTNGVLSAMFSDGTDFEEIGLIDGKEPMVPKEQIRDVAGEIFWDFFDNNAVDKPEQSYGTMDALHGDDGVIVTDMQIDADRNLIITTSLYEDDTVVDVDGKIVGKIDLGLIDGVDALIPIKDSLREDEGDIYISYEINNANDEAEHFIGHMSDLHGIDEDWIIALTDRTHYTINDTPYTVLDDGFGITSNYTTQSPYTLFDTVVAERMLTVTDNHEVESELGILDTPDNRYPVDFRNVDEHLVLTYSTGEEEVVATIADFHGEHMSGWVEAMSSENIFHDEADTMLYNDNDNLFGITHNNTVEYDPITYSQMDMERGELLYVTWNTGRLQLVGDINGANYEYLSDIRVTSDNDVIVTFSQGEERFMGNLPNFNGIDSEVIQSNFYTTSEAKTDALGNPITVDVVHVDVGVDSTTTRQITIGEANGRDRTNEITGVSINSDGKMEVSYLDGTTDISTDVFQREITDISYNIDELSILTNFDAPIVVGNTAGTDVPDGRSIDLISLNASRQLVVDYDDTTSKNLGAFGRVDFESATVYAAEGAEFDNHLAIFLTDSTPIHLGNIVGNSNTVDIIEALITIEGDLVLTRNEAMPTMTAPNIIGAMGNGISTADITVNGDLVFTMLNGSTINAGFVRMDLGFAPYNYSRAYFRGESATVNGRIFVALEDDLTTVPSLDNSSWAVVRFEGDPSPDASRPEVIAPIDNEVYPNTRPYLQGGDLRNYYSIDKRLKRIFVIDTEDGNFSTPVYTAEENLDAHQVEAELTPGTNYQWRMRDVIEQTGYYTDWSIAGRFSVIANDIALPVVSVATGYVSTAMPILAGFTSSAYSGTAAHQYSTWEVKRNSDDTIIYSEVTDTPSTDFVVPFAYLKESTSYSVRVRYHATGSDSAYSDWLTFTTADNFAFNFKPTVVFDGDDVNATVARPFFKSNSDMPRFFEEYMMSEGVGVHWQVYNSLNTMIWEDDNILDILDVQVGIPLTSNEIHSIRVRYESPRFTGYSEWSDYLSFTPQWVINAPAIDSNGDATAMFFSNIRFMAGNQQPATKVLDITAVDNTKPIDFSTVNSSLVLNVEGTIITFEEAVTSMDDLALKLKAHTLISDVVVTATSMTITTSNVGEKVFIQVDTFVIEEQIDDGLGGFTTNSITVVAADEKIYGEVLGFYAENDFHASTSWEIRRQDNNELVYSEYNEFDEKFDWTLNFYNEDSEQAYYAQVRYNGRFASSDWSLPYNFTLQSIDLTNVYFGMVDGKITHLNYYGNKMWDYKHTSQINSITNDDSQNIFAATADGSVLKIDKDGELVLTISDHTAAVNGVSYYDEGHVVTGSTDTTVKMFDVITGALVWNSTAIGVEILDVHFDMHGDVIAVSSNNNVYKLSYLDGSILWEFTGHTNNVTSVVADPSGIVYTTSLDGTLRRISITGREDWSISLPATATYVDVDYDGNVWATATNGILYRINKLDGVVIWEFTGHTASLASVGVDDNGNAFTGGTDRVIKAIDENGEELWSYIEGINSNITTVEVSRQELLLSPDFVTGKFIPLLEPDGVTAKYYA